MSPQMSKATDVSNATETGTGRAAAVIVAAGSGVRAGGDVPKQYRLLAGTPVLTRTLTRFLSHPSISLVVPIISEADRSLYAMAASAFDGHPKLGAPVIGGATRQASVSAGLEACATIEPDIVLVHDGVRPFPSEALISRIMNALATADGAISGLPISDTLKHATDGEISGTVDRTGLWGAQTPQAFRYATLLEAHRAARAIPDREFTDDAALLEWRGKRVAMVPGEIDNIKITLPDDFTRAERILAAAAACPAMLPIIRTGIGYDVHAFESGDHIMLGGVRIPHTHGVDAHSDGDVALHAATDALLGAIADGDIGTHFPPSDPAWKGAASARFLTHAADLVRKRGGVISNLDITIVAEAPRVGAHREAMRRAIADAAGTEPARVSIKATTSEKLGFLGRREGLAAFAIATVAFPAVPPSATTCTTQDLKAR